MTDPNEDLLDEFFLARIAAFQDGSLSEAELEQFNRELLEDAAKRRALVECQLQSARIRSVLVQESELARAAQNDPRQHDTIQYDSTESDSIVHESCDASRSRRRTFRRLGAVCATAACIVLGIFLSLRENSDAPDSKLVDAVLSYERSATWEESSRSPVVGDRLAARGYDLRAGRIRVEFAHGTIVTVRGPARFRFVDDTEMRLEYGKISVKIGRKDGQFSVLTESMEVLDLGTAFGMDVQRDGSATVSVFDGRVSAKTKSEAGERVLEEGMSASAEPGEALLSVP
ncbi:MAG: FecR domain-containing protein, partial [Planctomycetota bacterium]